MLLDDSYILTGPTAPALHRIKNRVSNLVRHCRWFYIGLTNRPWDRFCEHNRNDGIEWDRMVLLYTTSSLVKEGLFEQELIQYYRESPHKKKLKNIQSGAQGRLGVAPHYIYALLKYD